MSRFENHHVHFLLVPASHDVMGENALLTKTIKLGVDGKRILC